MSKKKILIVEDEPIIATDIELSLEKLGYEVTGIEDNINDALVSIKENKPDLILLDINLEGDEDGIMLAQDINKDFRIPFIFLTSNADQLTIQRVKRTYPAGFIVKPFNEKDLLSNIEIALFSSAGTNENNQDINTIFIKDGNSLIKLKIDEIMFIRADDNYSKIYTTTGDYVISTTLKLVENELPSNKFIRIHRSYLVNIHYIEIIKNSYVKIGKHNMPIGRSYQKELFNKISKI